MTKLDGLITSLNNSRQYENKCAAYMGTLVSVMTKRLGVSDDDKENTISVIPVVLKEGERAVKSDGAFAITADGKFRCALLLHLKPSGQYTYERDSGFSLPFDVTIQGAKKKHDNGSEMDSFTASSVGVDKFLPPAAYGESQSAREEFFDAVGDALTKQLKALLFCP